MRRRIRLTLVLAGAMVAVVTLVLLLVRPTAAPSRSPIAWRLQPDSYTVGTILQGRKGVKTVDWSHRAGGTKAAGRWGMRFGV